MVHVVEITSLQQLDGYRLAWKSLLGRTRGASYFQSLDWFEPYWRHFGNGQRLRVLVVKGSEGTIGILPLVIQIERTKVGPIRVLTYPLEAGGSFYAPIGPHPTATLIAGLSHVRRTERDWDLVDFRGIHRYGTDFGRTEHALRGLGYQAYEQPWRTTATVELPKTWSDYQASRTDSWRETLARYEQALADEFHVEFVRYRPEGAACADDDPRWDLYHACQRMTKARGQALPSTGALAHDLVQEHSRDAHEAATAAGAIDLSLLVLDGRPAAFIDGYHFCGHVSVHASGCDAGALADAVQGVLLARMIEDSLARGDGTIDLGAGHLKNPHAWQTTESTSYRYTHFAGTARAQALRVSRLASGCWRRIAG